ncbi:adenylate/guanylate cyclase domain-containing protein [Tardiphaga sp.]|jgi:adenylate cyclase|uniref:adenylate/guanylate cyclase domain-containing protein n=1 Tax=Tardiphaga sp. TaxID=1926292 RepID=UPI0037DA0620
MKHTQWRVSFRTSIIAVFVGIVLTVGLALLYLSFSRVNAIVRTAASSYLGSVAQSSADRIDGQLKSVRDNLDILRGMPSVQAADISDNQRLYNLLASMLRNNRQLGSLYMGYDDGSFLEMDFIERLGPEARKRMGAPEAAAFRMFLIVKSGPTGARQASTAYIDGSLRVLQRVPGPDDYDPRKRPWYAGAFEPDAALLTAPYIFHLIGNVGYTLRLPISGDGAGVVAGDILIGEAETMLRQQGLGKSGVAFLFDEAGRVLAHPDLSKWLGARVTGDHLPDLPRLADVDKVGASSAIEAWRKTGQSEQFFKDRNGREYLAAIQPVNVAGTADLRVIVFAPIDEFYSDIVAERRSLIIVAMLMLLTALPLAFLIGNRLSLSLRILAREVDRIQRFRFSTMPRLRSPIREIDDLGRSVYTMRSLVQTFSHFVPKRLVQQLVETGDSMELGGTRREATILFTDVENFTSLTEEKDPTQVMLYTSRYFAAISNVIAANQGTVDKFIGDAVMGIWNAPVEYDDHVLQACEAVLRCIEVNQALNEEFEREGWPAYNTRFGIHVGDTMIGNIGSSDRMNYTALGATVNLASRLETLNKDYGTRALVSQAVKDAAEARFTFRSVATIKPKGFAREVGVYELLGRRRDAPALPLTDVVSPAV